MHLVFIKVLFFALRSIKTGIITENYLHSNENRHQMYARNRDSNCFELNIYLYLYLMKKNDYNYEI